MTVAFGVLAGIAIAALAVLASGVVAAALYLRRTSLSVERAERERTAIALETLRSIQQQQEEIEELANSVGSTGGYKTKTNPDDKERH